MTTTRDVIEELVKLVHGASDLRTQTLYRTNLQVLVELAKAEQRHESNMEFPNMNRPCNQRMIH